MRAIRAEVRTAAKSSLTVPQFRVLANINHGLRRVGEIAQHHGVSQPAMSRIVEGLVARKLIKRSPSAEDRRAIELVLTPRGKILFEKVRSVASDELSHKMDEFTKAEIDEFYMALVHLQKYMKQILKVKG